MRKIAIVHDWFTTYAGSERVVEQMLFLYPEADLFSLVDFLPPDQRGFLCGKPIRTSFLQKLPFARQKYRQYLPLMPLAIESLDVSAYNLVISSSHAVAKGVLTGPDQLHISNIYSPIRYAWDMQSTYLANDGMSAGAKGKLALALLHYIRLWDLRTVNSVDAMIAISRYVARRVRKYYRRDAAVIYPPVDIEKFTLCEQKEDYYLVVSRLVQYKRVDCIIEAFNQMPDRRLVVIGDGPDLKRLMRLAGPNIHLLGYQSSAVVAQYMQRARAFVYAAEEDFGIVLLEAQACGTPVIAYGQGGALETILGQESGHPTGYFFYEQTPLGMCQAIEGFEWMRGAFSPLNCRANAVCYAPECFRQQFSNFVETQWDQFTQS